MEQLAPVPVQHRSLRPGYGGLMIFVAIILIVPSLTQALYAALRQAPQQAGIEHILFRFLLFFSSFQFLLRDSRSLRCNGRRLLPFTIFSPLPAGRQLGALLPADPAERVGVIWYAFLKILVVVHIIDAHLFPNGCNGKVGLGQHPSSPLHPAGVDVLTSVTLPHCGTGWTR